MPVNTQITRNLAIANRSCIGSTHKVTTVRIKRVRQRKLEA